MNITLQPSITMLVQALLQIYCSPTTATVARLPLVARTGSIGHLRPLRVARTLGICTSVRATSVQPLAAIAGSGAPSVACSAIR